MEQAQALLREGVMSHLEELETLSRNLTLRQEQKRHKHEELEKMKEMVVKLRKERDDLRAKVTSQETQLCSFSAQEPPHHALHRVPESTQDDVLEKRLEEVKEILEAYWLTGISGKQTKKGVCVCLSTAFEGTYLDSYYVELVTQQRMRIEHHSVPPFIPLEQITKEHLQTDLKKFLSVLFEHLNGYAGRKYQIDQLQAVSMIVVPGSLQRNSLCTLLTFQYNVKVEGRVTCFHARLLYGELTRVLPTEALITCTDTALPDATLSSHSELFSKKPLHAALELLKSANETLNRTSISLLGTELF
ncbi:centromere protein O [Pelodytes ibericus]